MGFFAVENRIFRETKGMGVGLTSLDGWFLVRNLV